ncbi:hypothetical protein [Undibacterium sp.]|uniref:hypothetical protein n=1 Tax=Undibacterium sp. TaxID=1914977 RepID=UPI0025E5DC36|nr:hypothetical protein [Undibacterium sp.]
MTNPFHLQQQTHLALAQYYRWYQVYEVPLSATRIANQKAILSDDVEITSQMGTSKGKADLQQRLELFTGWQNAHHVQNTEVKLLPDGKLSLEADIVYQNIRPDLSRHSYRLHYATVLVSTEQDLPVFEKLDLQATGQIAQFDFEPAYAENRSKSFMHYWLYLLETANGDSTKLHELLADDFSLELSEGQHISNLPQFDTWISAIPQRLSASSHAYKNFKVLDHGDQSFSVTLDFDWQGFNLQGQAMRAESQHEWLLENDMELRFAKLKSMRVRMLKPFQIVDA